MRRISKRRSGERSPMHQGVTDMLYNIMDGSLVKVALLQLPLLCPFL